MPRFVTCGPNEAIIVSGCCHSNPLMVPGGRVFVWPLFHKIQRISLNTMTLNVESPKVYSEGGVPVTVKGVAQVKIQGKDLAGLRAAIEMFLDKTEDEIMDIAKATLEGHQRSIIASMEVKNIYKDRKKFSKDVQQSAQTDLIDMGLTLISYTVQDISDDDGYLAAIGEEQTIGVKADARKEMARTKKQSECSKIDGERLRSEHEATNNLAIESAKKDFEMKKAEFNCEVFTKKAESDLAENLQSAQTEQKIVKQQMNVKLMEKELESQILLKKIEQRKHELKAQIEQQADADFERASTLAAAYKKKTMLEAEAEANAIRIRSEAEAEVIKLKAEADAKRLERRAAAFTEYRSAAKLEMVLTMLPKVIAEIAEPLSNCNKMTVISQDSSVGFGKISSEVFSIMDQINGVLGVENFGQLTTLTSSNSNNNNNDSSNNDHGGSHSSASGGHSGDKRSPHESEAPITRLQRPSTSSLFSERFTKK